MRISALCLLGLFLDFLVWQEILFLPKPGPEFAFLDVGQGDSELVVLAEGAVVLVDAGPDGSVEEALGEIRGRRRYIDLGIITHPELDHFNGFKALVERYRFGALIINGRNPATPSWEALLAAIKSKGIPLITLARGDTIRQGSSSVSFLSPGPVELYSADLNDTALVALAQTGGIRTLLAADISAALERRLTGIEAEILKVAHHGSAFSSDPAFLARAKPKIAIIEAGERNRYGHPASSTLRRLDASGAMTFRTDISGTVRITPNGRALEIATER